MRLTPTSLSSKPTYTDIVKLWGELAPYELNTMLASTVTMQDLLNIDEFKDATAGLNFQGTGKLVTPFGSEFASCSVFERQNHYWS